MKFFLRTYSMSLASISNTWIKYLPRTKGMSFMSISVWYNTKCTFIARVCVCVWESEEERCPLFHVEVQNKVLVYDIGVCSFLRFQKDRYNFYIEAHVYPSKPQGALGMVCSSFINHTHLLLPHLVPWMSNMLYIRVADAWLRVRSHVL